MFSLPPPSSGLLRPPSYSHHQKANPWNLTWVRLFLQPSDYLSSLSSLSYAMWRLAQVGFSDNLVPQCCIQTTYFGKKRTKQQLGRWVLLITLLTARKPKCPAFEFCANAKMSLSSKGKDHQRHSKSTALFALKCFCPSHSYARGRI